MRITQKITILLLATVSLLAACAGKPNAEQKSIATASAPVFNGDLRFSLYNVRSILDPAFQVQLNILLVLLFWILHCVDLELK